MSEVIYSVDEFCASHKIGRTTFYALCRAGRGPVLTKLGQRTLITAEAAADWRRRMERESNPSFWDMPSIELL